MILQFTLPKLKSSYNYYLLVAFIIYTVYYCFHKNEKVNLVPIHLHKYLKCEVNTTKLTLGELWETVEKINEKREVKHWRKHGPLHSDTPIIVVRVHRDLERLQYLIVSLAQTANIQTVLLIFSHSYYDERINYLIRQIDFCMVLQIFYPNSLQLYPHNFPGVDAGDCVNGIRSVDSYCVERDATVTETKQHWWWTANFVFEQLFWAPTHKHMVVFIDEASYVLPDFLYMLKASKSSLNYVSDAEVLAFGRPLAIGLDYNKLTVASWKPPYDKGMAFNRTTWHKITELNSFYCQFDDTSWSYSLLHLFEKFYGGHVMMVACMAPRVISTSVFQSGRVALENIWEVTRSDQLFPKRVQAVMLFGQDGRALTHHRASIKGNGGWNDSRDRELCLEPMGATVNNDESTTTPPIFTTEH